MPNFFNNNNYRTARGWVENLTNGLSRALFMAACLYKGPISFMPMYLRFPVAVLLGGIQFGYNWMFKDQLYAKHAKPQNKQQPKSNTGFWQKARYGGLLLFSFLIAGALFFSKLVFFQSLLHVTSAASVFALPCALLAGLYALRLLMRHLHILGGFGGTGRVLASASKKAQPSFWTRAYQRAAVYFLPWKARYYQAILFLAPLVKELFDCYALYQIAAVSLGLSFFWTASVLGLACVSGLVLNWYKNYFYYQSLFGEGEQSVWVTDVLTVFAKMVDCMEDMLTMRLAPISVLWQTAFVVSSVGYLTFELLQNKVIIKQQQPPSAKDDEYAGSDGPDLKLTRAS